MSEFTFEVGEVAVYCRPGPNFGMEVTVTGPLQFARVRDSMTNQVNPGSYYPIDPPPNYFKGPFRSKIPRTWARPEDLRKKRPPREDLKLVRWDECPWSPIRETT